MQPEHPPLPNVVVLLSIFGLIFSFVVWKVSASWGFLLLLFSIILFLASFVSAVRAPLPTDHDIHLAAHEQFSGRRYPDTDLHHGLIPQEKRYISRHKKKLVQVHLESQPKPSVKKPVIKKPVAKVAKKPVKTSAKKKLSKRR